MEEVTFNFDARELYVTVDKNHKTKISQLSKPIQIKIAMRIEELVTHFKKNGWKLDLGMIQEDIVSDIMGIEFFDELATEILLNVKNSIIIYGDRNFIALTKGHVFYNPQINKISIYTKKKAISEFDVYLGVL